MLGPGFNGSKWLTQCRHTPWRVAKVACHTRQHKALWYRHHISILAPKIHVSIDNLMYTIASARRYNQPWTKINPPLSSCTRKVSDITDMVFSLVVLTLTTNSSHRTIYQPFDLGHQPLERCPKIRKPTRFRGRRSRSRQQPKNPRRKPRVLFRIMDQPPHRIRRIVVCRKGGLDGGRRRRADPRQRRRWPLYSGNLREIRAISAIFGWILILVLTTSQSDDLEHHDTCRHGFCRLELRGVVCRRSLFASGECSGGVATARDNKTRQKKRQKE
jgi:hypothetical protein